MEHNDITAYLAQHPKMTGVLFTSMLLLSQTGSAMAAIGSTCSGP
jgi:hypothetical protein